MKNIITLRSLITLLVIACATTAWSQSIDLPRTASPAAEVSQTIGISTVSVNYSRPAVKGREIWGKLVPYGWNVEGFGLGNSAPWRAGANENTVITFSHDAKVEGKMVPAGSYGLFFTINADNSGEVILSKDHHSWGNYFYDAAQDQLRAKIKIRSNNMTELLTYDFINLNKNGGELVLNWEAKQFPVKIEFDVDAIVMANASDELKGALGFDWEGYSTAANYSLQNNFNLEQGLQWAMQAAAMNPSFTTLTTKGMILRMQGNDAEADKANAEALTMANEVEMNAYGYQLLNLGQKEEAIAIFKANTEKYPESANAWDSLGEGYALNGDKKEAIKAFKKSLSLDPEPNVRANSEKYLKELGAK